MSNEPAPPPSATTALDNAQRALAEIERGAVDLVSRDELLSRLREFDKGGKALRVKAGFDPTRPDLHLGHVVLMNKLAQFQKLGHKVVFIVGDFTAQVGDPTGRNKSRPALTRDEVLAGAKTYAEQAFKVLDKEKTELRYNSEWLEKLSPVDFVKLAAKRTVERTLDRKDFRERFEAKQPIFLHEFLYPLLQAYDSVVIDADIELGGTDQLFNLNVGRDLMTAYDKRPQMVLTVPLLEGLDAKMVDGKVVGEKMSKSADNYVGVAEEPFEQFRKLLSVNDGVIWRYFDLLSEKGADEIAALKKSEQDGTLAAREAQRIFAREIVTRFHGDEAAKDAEARYDANRAGGFPSDAPAHSIGVDPKRGTLWLAVALKTAGLAESVTAARTLMKQGGVTLDGAKVRDEQHQLDPGKTYEVVVGGKNKRYARVTVTA